MTTKTQGHTRRASSGPAWLTVKEAAEYLRVSEVTIRRYIGGGELLHYRKGHTIRIKPEDLDAMFTASNAWTQGGCR